MKKRSKLLVITAAMILIVVCMSAALTGCRLTDEQISQNLNALADEIALALLGNDAVAWNAFSANPQGSYGYVKDGAYSWYSYSSMSEQDAKDMYYAFYLIGKQLSKIDSKRLYGADIATYNSLENIVNTYTDYYGSEYAVDFALIGGDYINSQGGYVADFTSTVENYIFRDKGDMDDLLAIIRSTDDAFATYLDYARDRIDAGYPLYDYTIDEMKAYLDEVLEQGDNYYLYGFVNNKIDAVSFLNPTQKITYKNYYRSAIKNNFMVGVKNLSDNIARYKGSVTQTQMSYLASYGKVGKEYYTWMFKNKTGISNVDMDDIYDDLAECCDKYYDLSSEVLEYVESVKVSDKALYTEFNEYLSGERAILDLQTPEDILSYLQSAAKDIVPDLSNVPDIDFKYMDDTVAKRSHAVAYYMTSAADESNSAEHITLNPYYMDNTDELMLTTIAHEGYPGHLYSRVRAKELGISLLTTINYASAFSEGWAVYTEIILLDNIAASTQSEALKLFCKYNSYYTVSGYLNALLMDMRLNYFGMSVNDMVKLGIDREYARDIINRFMEIPTVYVSYAYGVYAMLEMHSQAKDNLGDKYNEVEYNGILLSEGMGPTIDRAWQLTDNYIKSK